MGCYPLLPKQRKEFMPVDFVVSAMLNIASTNNNLGHAYNLVQPEPGAAIDLETTFDIINDLSPTTHLRGLPYPEWVKRLSHAVEDPLHRWSRC